MIYKMFSRKLIVVLGILTIFALANKCIYNSNYEHSGAQPVCVFLTNRNFSRQCYPDDLTLISGTGPLDEQAFWIDKGEFCTQDTCEALVFNSTDDEAPTSIMCLNCRELHGVVCDDGAKPCELSEISVTAGHSTSCSQLWIPAGDKEFFISPVRRNMLDSQQWCLSKNGTALDHVDELSFVNAITLPEPAMKTYWVAVSINDINNGNVGVVLTTKNRGIRLTSKFKIDSASQREFNNMYGCICIRNLTMPSTTTPPPPTTTTTAATTTTHMLITSTIKLVSAATNNEPGEVLTGKYKNIQTNNGLMKTPGAATQTSAKRSSECAMKCDRTSGCNAYFFDKLTSSCQLVDGINPKQSCDNVPSAKYYQKQ